jgi:hypothetical protein
MSNIDGLVILKKSRISASTDDFKLQPVDSSTVSPSEEFVVSNIRIDTADAWYRMQVRFGKGLTDTTLKQAFVSLFIDSSGNDTVRVLHLASYTACRIERLEPGWYDETFRFSLPAGKRIENRRHEIWMYAKQGYLPFFARPEYRYRLCRKIDLVRLH